MTPVAAFALGVAVAYLVPSLGLFTACALDGDERAGQLACGLLAAFWFIVGVAAIHFGVAS